MGGRLEKYGNVKRKAQLRKNEPGRKTMFKNLCMFCRDVIAVYAKSEG